MSRSEPGYTLLVALICSSPFILKKAPWVRVASAETAVIMMRMVAAVLPLPDTSMSPRTVRSRVPETPRDPVPVMVSASTVVLTFSVHVPLLMVTVSPDPGVPFGVHSVVVVQVLVPPFQV